MRIEKLLQMPENRIRWVEMIKRHEAMRTSWNDRAKEAAALVEEMKEQKTPSELLQEELEPIYD